MRLAAGLLAVASLAALTPSAGSQVAGLRLLVATSPPFVLDVRTGAVTRVRGLRPLDGRLVSVAAVGGRAGIVVADGGANADLYAVTTGGSGAVALGVGEHAWPAAGGDAVWVQTRTGSGCRLRLVGLDGRVRRAARRLSCATASDPAGGSLGLVVRRTRIVDPRTGREVLRTRAGILAVAGRRMVLLDGKELVLLDPATGREYGLRWPSILAGGDRPAVDPHGRWVVLAFADPAWPDGGQRLDLWLLDVRNAELTQLPGMPMSVFLKGTDVAWTDDGRVVLLGEDDGGKAFVGVWRPGDERISVTRVRLPKRDGSSDSFAPLR